MKYKRKKGQSFVKAKKHTYKGVEYKSGLELYAAKAFDSAAIPFQYEPDKFILQEGYKVKEELYERQGNGKGDFKNRGSRKILPLTYKPDFVGANFICETKGFAGEAFPIRWKLFLKQITEGHDERLMIFKPQSQGDVDEMIKVILSKPSEGYYFKHKKQ